MLIVGGGFAGLACSQRLPARDFDVTLIDRRRDFEYLPGLHELLSGRRRAAQLRLPLAALQQRRGHRFRRADVTAVDPRRRTLRLAGGAELQGDYLVLSPGSVEAGAGVPGVAEHAFTLRSVADGLALQRRLRALRRERAAAGRSAPRVLVAGAGWTGLEALGELLRGGAGAPLDLHLVDAASQVLPGAAPGVSAFLEQRCREQGVSLHLGRAVERLTAKTVFLEGGQRLRAQLVLWAVGAATPALLRRGLAPAPAGPQVQGDLSLPGHPQCFVAGDGADTARSLKRQAYHALDMGAQAAQNIRRLAAGRRSRAFRPLPRPSLLAFGDSGAVLIAGHRALAGQPLALAKEGIYLAVMAQLDRRPPAQRAAAACERVHDLPGQWWPLLRDWRRLPRTGGVVRVS